MKSCSLNIGYDSDFDIQCSISNLQFSTATHCLDVVYSKAFVKVIHKKYGKSESQGKKTMDKQSTQVCKYP